MIARDQNQVIRIENLSFSDPHTWEELLIYLRPRSCIGLVAEIKDQVVGYLIYDRIGYNENRDFDGEINIVRVAVHPRFRRLHVGTQMVDKIVKKMISEGKYQYQKVTAIVPERNIVTQLWLRSLSFWAEDILKGFYTNLGDPSEEDGYLMTYMIPHKRD